MPTCDSCCIQIGPQYLEKVPYHIGEYCLCAWCLKNLISKGYVELERRPVKGHGTVCKWLYLDGTTKYMRLILTKMNAYFIPIEIPLPEPLPEDILEGEC